MHRKETVMFHILQLDDKEMAVVSSALQIAAKVQIQYEGLNNCFSQFKEEWDKHRKEGIYDRIL